MVTMLHFLKTILAVIREEALVIQLTGLKTWWQDFHVSYKKNTHELKISNGTTTITVPVALERLETILIKLKQLLRSMDAHSTSFTPYYFGIKCESI